MKRARDLLFRDLRVATQRSWCFQGQPSCNIREKLCQSFIYNKTVWTESPSEGTTTSYPEAKASSALPCEVGNSSDFLNSAGKGGPNSTAFSGHMWIYYGIDFNMFLSGQAGLGWIVDEQTAVVSLEGAFTLNAQKVQVNDQNWGAVWMRVFSLPHWNSVFTLFIADINEHQRTELIDESKITKSHTCSVWCRRSRWNVSISIFAFSLLDLTIGSLWPAVRWRRVNGSENASRQRHFVVANVRCALF